MLRSPVRPLDIGDIAYAFPREMLVDFSTGSITFLDDTKNQILNKNPGTLTIKAGSTTLLDSKNLSEAITLSLATVANSGSYNDLSNKPAIPAAGSVTPSAPGTASAGASSAFARADHVHPLQTSVSGSAGKLATPVNIGLSGAVTATPQAFDGSAAITIPITALDGTKITGLIPLSSIPQGAQERLIPVADDTARLALTASDAQNGDVVKVQSTGLMYYIVDDTVLGTEAAFEIFTAGAASSVAWSGITGKPTFAAVATSGKYSDLSGAPSLTIVSSGTGNAVTDITVSNHEITFTKGATYLTSHPIISMGIDSSSSSTLGFGDTFSTVTGITRDTNGHVTEVDKKSLTLPSLPFIPGASSVAPLAAGTASAGTSTAYAREDHIHPLQTSVSGNAGTATKLADAVKIGLSGVTATAQSFDGSKAITIPITAVPSSIVTGLATVATSGKYSDLSGTPTIPTASNTAPLANGAASSGTGTTWARADHVHPAQTSVSGNAGTATKLANSVNIGLSGAVSATAQSFDGSANITIPVNSIDGTKITGLIPLASIPKGAQERLVPVADDTARLALTSDDVQNGDVVKVQDTGIMYYVVDDEALGSEDAFDVFTAGAASSVAWSGITGKPTFAAVATSGKYSDLSGAPSLSVSSSGSGNAVTNITVSGHAISITKGATYLTEHPTISMGTDSTSTASPGYGGTFTVIDKITKDTNGHITAVNTKTITMPSAQTLPSAGTITPKVAGTASAGTSTAYAREDHVHPLQTSVSGNAGTASRLASAVSIGLSGVTATAQSFDGSKAITIPITAVPSSIVTGLATVATSGKYSDLSGTPTIPTAATVAPKASGTATIGTSTAYAREDHIHPVQTSVSGNAGTATKLAAAVKIGLRGAVTATAQSFDGSKAITIPITALDGTKITGLIPLSSIPKGAQERLVPVANDTARLALTIATVQNGDVVKVQDTGIMYYVVDEEALGTEAAFEVFTAGAASSVPWTGVTGKPTFAAVATSGKYSDLTGTPSLSISSSGSGNAVTNITVSGHAITFTKGATYLTAHPKISMGSNTTSSAAPGYGGTFTVIDKITKDTNGHVTKVNTKTITMPSAQTLPSAGTITPKVAGTASVGTSTAYAREDHIHPLQTTVSGNAGTATKLAAAVKIGLSGVTATAQSFDGSKAITIPITAVPSSIVTGLATVATSGKYSDLTGIPATISKTIYTGTIGTDWSGSKAPYSSAITVSGLTTDDVNNTSILDLNLSDSTAYDTAKQISDEFGYIYRAVITGANTITFYASEKTTVSIPFQLTVFR